MGRPGAVSAAIGLVVFPIIAKASSPPVYEPRVGPAA